MDHGVRGLKDAENKLGENNSGPPPFSTKGIADYLDTETARIDALIEKKRMIELLDRTNFLVELLLGQSGDLLQNRCRVVDRSLIGSYTEDCSAKRPQPQRRGQSGNWCPPVELNDWETSG